MPLAALNVKTLEEIILGKCDSFVNMGIWPAGEKLSYSRWLDNFEFKDREHALYLLNSFTYFNLDLSISLLKGAIMLLSKNVGKTSSRIQDASNWASYLNSSIFIPAVGESRNITDSGTFIAGSLRRELYIPEQNIFTLEQLYDTRFQYSLQSFDRIIFFDDFVGSGKQFLEMWNEPFEKDSHLLEPVKDKCKALKFSAHYCGMIGTTYGLTNIAGSAPEVELCFSHVLQYSDSALHLESSIWPEHLKISGPEFIHRSSNIAGIPYNEQKGFHDLGLSLAFCFTIPDATLPLFRWDKGNWAPLMKKS